MATAVVQRLENAGANQTARWRRSLRLARRLWRGVRDWCGDSAYERYLIAVKQRDSGPALSQEKFYVEQLQRRYSRPSRCC